MNSPEQLTRSAETWVLKLYIAGQTGKSIQAFDNLKQICEQYLAGRYMIEIIDLSKHPQRAAADQVLAIPTVIRQLPLPIRKVIGDLSDTERVLVGLDLYRAPLARPWTAS